MLDLNKIVQGDALTVLKMVELNKIYLGDCIEIMKTFPDNSVDAIITDPPYGLEFMGKDWDKFKEGKNIAGGTTGLNTPFGRSKALPSFFQLNKGKIQLNDRWQQAGKPSMEKFEGHNDWHSQPRPRMINDLDSMQNFQEFTFLWATEALRVLKAGGHLLSFGGTRTYHRMACAIEDAGFEIRDMIEWVYGSGFPKSLNIGKMVDKLQGNEREITETKIKKAGDMSSGNFGKGGDYADIEVNITKGNSEWEGWGTALKPSHEIICMATKPFNTIPLNTIEDCDVLWELNSFVKIVEELLKLNLQELNEDMLNSVLLNAEVKNNILGDLKEVMDMLRSKPQIINSILNTMLLWKNIWEESLNLLNISTTEIKSEMITELRILKSLIGQLTLLNIIQAKDNQVSGKNGSVLIVENLLQGVYWKLNATQMYSVQENVTLLEKTNTSVNNNPIVLARKPLSEKTVAENVLKFGTGGINIDECRIGTEIQKPSTMPDLRDVGAKSKEAIGIDKLSFGQVQDAKRKEYVPTAIGRFPPNLIHDGSKEVVSLFPDCDGEIGRVGRKSAGNYDATSFKMGVVTETGIKDTGSAVRFFYCAKASKEERNFGCDELAGEYKTYVKNRRCRKCDYQEVSGSPCKCKNPDWEVIERETTTKNNHPTVKPVKLMEYLVKLVTPPKGIVLDLFAGSGSTCIACAKLGFNFIGIEKEVDYCKIAEARLKPYLAQKKLEVD